MSDLSGYYSPGMYDQTDNREIAEALEGLGLEFKQAQVGGASAGEIIDIVVAWVSLKDVVVGAASGTVVLAVEKVAQAIHGVVRKKAPAPGTRNTTSISIYDQKNEFYTTVWLDVDHPVSTETITEILDAARSHKEDRPSSDEDK